MREIDFLPEWYKAGNKRRVSYRIQYTIIGGLFVSLMVWSFVAGISLSVVEARVDSMQNSLDSYKPIAAKYDHYGQILALLQDRADRLDKLDSGINMAELFGELSFLATDDIILTGFEIKSETLKEGFVMAQEAIDSGKAKAALAGLVAETNA